MQGSIPKQRRSYLAEHLRNAIYDAERIAFFMANYEKRSLPIWIEGFSTVEIFNGYHRYIAALACKDNFINVEYDGQSNILDYLKGERKTRPRR